MQWTTAELEKSINFSNDFKNESAQENNRSSNFIKGDDTMSTNSSVRDETNNKQVDELSWDQKNLKGAQKSFIVENRGRKSNAVKWNPAFTVPEGDTSVVVVSMADVDWAYSAAILPDRSCEFDTGGCAHDNIQRKLTYLVFPIVMSRQHTT